MRKESLVLRGAACQCVEKKKNVVVGCKGNVKEIESKGLRS